MLKLTKYEFRKNLTSTIIILLVLAAAEIYFLISCAFKNEIHAAVSISFLALLSFVSYIIVIVFGINAYSKELKSKSSYLIFMTPNSSLSIIVSKILYTFLFGCALLLILVGLSVLNVMLLSNISGNILNYVDILKMILTSMGLQYMSIVYALISGFVSLSVSVLVIIALSYFSITLASTWLQNKKIKGFASTVIFIIIAITTGLIANHLPVIYPSPATTFQAIATILPAIIFDLVIIIACTFGSAILLDKKVSL